MSDGNSALPLGDGGGGGGQTVEKFAGKYADDAAALKGVNEIRKQIGLDEFQADKPLYGDQGYFKTREDAERSYKEYERVYHATRKNNQPPPTSLDIKPDPIEDLSPKAIIEKSGLKAEELESSIKAGGLTADQIKALRAADPSLKNKSDAMIQTLAKGYYYDIQAEQQRRAEAFNAADQIVGGRQQHEAIRDWAKNNIPKNELDDWMDVISKKPSMYPSMIREFDYRYRASIGSNNSGNTVQRTTSSGSGVPTNAAEFNALMDRVTRGDGEAMRILNSMDVKTIASFG